MIDCESCAHYPPSATDGKPCCICYPGTTMSYFQKKEQEPMFEEKIIWHEVTTRPLCMAVELGV